MLHINSVHRNNCFSMIITRHRHVLPAIALRILELLYLGTMWSLSRKLLRLAKDLSNLILGFQIIGLWNCQPIRSVLKLDSYFVEFGITQSASDSNLQIQAWWFQGYLSRWSPRTSFEGAYCAVSFLLLFCSFFFPFCFIFKFVGLAKYFYFIFFQVLRSVLSIHGLGSWELFGAGIDRENQS